LSVTHGHESVLKDVLGERAVPWPPLRKGEELPTVVDELPGQFGIQGGSTLGV
jgi:hypothetical protein